MIFSKSFDYALRSILYVSLMNDTKKRVRVEEISSKIDVPKHFLGKIMNKVVKKGILDSTKGPFGGFSLNEKTPGTSLLTLQKTVDGFQPFSYCVLKMKKCNPAHPCPLHDQLSLIRDNIHQIMLNTTIGDLAKGSKPNLLRSVMI